MLIVLEGCDGVGKTYLAERLLTVIQSRHTGYTDIIHHGVPTVEDMYDEYSLNFYRPGMNEHYILDRWHLGEWVYGRLYRGVSKLGMRGLASIDNRLKAVGALRLILDEADAQVALRLEAKGEDYLQAHHQGRVLNEYRMLSRHLNWIQVTSHADPDVLIDWAESLENQAVATW